MPWNGFLIDLSHATVVAAKIVGVSSTCASFLHRSYYDYHSLLTPRRIACAGDTFALLRVYNTRVNEYTCLISLCDPFLRGLSFMSFFTTCELYALQLFEMLSVIHNVASVNIIKTRCIGICVYDFSIIKIFLNNPLM